MSRPSILHCDAYVIHRGALNYLVIDWREGGKVQVALDAYLIEGDALTPVWDANGIIGAQVYWSPLNAPMMARLHKRVLIQAHEAEQAGRWARVMIHAHYVMTRETDPMGSVVNKYVERVDTGAGI